MRSVSQRYQAGDSSMKGSAGPNMNTLPKKLLRKSVRMKYTPLMDTVAMPETQIDRQTDYSVRQNATGHSDWIIDLREKSGAERMTDRT